MKIATATFDGKTREIELTEDQAKQFEEPKVWVPKVGDYYYFINSDGAIVKYTWLATPYDVYRLKTNKVFQTEEDAEFDREREIVTAELDNYAKEHNKPIDWKDYGQDKYSLSWDYEVKEIRISTRKTSKGVDVYFSSVEIAKAAVKAVNPDRVKKYYLGVVND